MGISARNEDAKRLPIWMWNSKFAIAALSCWRTVTADAYQKRETSPVGKAHCQIKSELLIKRGSACLMMSYDLSRLRTAYRASHHP